MVGLAIHKENLSSRIHLTYSAAKENEMRQLAVLQMAFVCCLIIGSMSLTALADETPVNAPSKEGKPTDQTTSPTETKRPEEKLSPGGALIMKPHEPITQPREPFTEDRKPLEKPREPRK